MSVEVIVDKQCKNGLRVIKGSGGWERKKKSTVPRTSGRERCEIMATGDGPATDATMWSKE